MSKNKIYPMRLPRYAAGIRAQETRLGAAQSWWAARWRECLEVMSLGARLGRGKSYALNGQVIEMLRRGNRIAARVVGVRKDPYRVTIDFRQPSPEAHARIATAIREEPILLARLLADDLPMEVEELFRANGCTLFPGGKLAPHVYDMTTACSCPDYANPCKHSTAVLFLLGEEIARHPLTLLELRGFTVEELLNCNH